MDDHSFRLGDHGRYLAKTLETHEKIHCLFIALVSRRALGQRYRRHYMLGMLPKISKRMVDARGIFSLRNLLHNCDYLCQISIYIETTRLSLADRVFDCFRPNLVWHLAKLLVATNRSASPR